MKCFYIFKDKGKIRAEKSPPNLKTQDKSDAPVVDSTAKFSNSPTPSQNIPKEITQSLRVFSFAELRQATSNFCKLLKIGEGGFGCVYKGIIKPVDGIGESLVVAIKKLNRDGLQGHKQWVAEVQVLGVVDHPNLVKLIGYCAVDGEKQMQRLLVYEYMPNKSLEYHLFNTANPLLSWERRLQIVLGAARGLAYLHEGLEPQVIYRDFKSSNVLLDADFQPKLSDFGLAREGPTNGHTHVSTMVVGTHGYTAPDYIETGRLTSKSDVWSFGVVLYEIITGRRPIERDRLGFEQKLLDWVRQHPAESRTFCKIIDPRLGELFPTNTAHRVAKLADRCLVKNPKDRPRMGDVVETLKETLQMLGTKGSPEDSEYEDECDEVEDNTGLTESAMRRMVHLAKMTENLEERRVCDQGK